jgi:Tol biopolymer transport system component
MSQLPRGLSDAAIELGLEHRAPHGADPTLLAEVMATVTAAPQRSRWSVPIRLPGRGSGRFALITAGALVATLLVAMLAGLSGSSPPRPAVVAPSSASSSEARSVAPSTISSGQSGCLAGTLRAIAVPPGAASEPRAAFAGLDGGRVAYLDPTHDLATGYPGVGVWVAANNNAMPKLVATVTGDHLDVAGLGRLPAASSVLLLKIGRAGLDRDMPACSDLFVASLDTSAVVKVTDSGPDGDVWAASLSPDGRTAAYVSTKAGETLFHVAPTAGTPGSQAPLDCPDPAHALTAAWSVGGDRIALGCGPRIFIFDPSARSIGAFASPGGDPQAISWAGDESLRIATAERTTPGALDVWSLDPGSGGAVRLAHAVGQGADWGPFPAPAFSPEGKFVIATTTAAGGGPGPTWLLDVEASRLERILNPDQNAVPGALTWASTGRSYAYLDFAHRTRPTVRRHPIYGGSDTIVGGLPPTLTALDAPPLAMDLR